jgi:hypothetical protein
MESTRQVIVERKIHEEKAHQIITQLAMETISEETITKLVIKIYFISY